MTVQYDIAIVGGGMVGGLLACALGNSRFKVLVIEAGEIPAFTSTDSYALRVSALSLASQYMLEQVGAWRGVVDRRACPYSRLQVWDGVGGGETLFESAEISATHLGHIVENHVLQLALTERLQQFDNVDFRTATRIDQLAISDDSAKIVTNENESIFVSLIVGADGGNSRVRQLTGIETSGGMYADQHALVATIETQMQQQDITWQRFMPGGPEAFLPLCGHYGSIVWYNTPEEVARLKTLSERNFIDELEAKFPTQLGDVRSIVGRGSFPLAQKHANQYIKPRIALVGDAAHTVHPLAGQGVNLGLLDAGTLAEVLLESTSSDVAEWRDLRRYERWRKGHNRLMQAALDGFYRAFKPQPAAVKILRSAVLDAANRLSPLNQLCMRFASGLEGDLPKLARCPVAGM
ncbi:MAG: UbiH/UbiF/VisC/COQ6 family ubiquinone biosynthesis hydroxylase [Pseudomonadota bacterium]